MNFKYFRSLIVLPGLLFAAAAVLGAVSGCFSFVEDFSATQWHDASEGSPPLWQLAIIPLAVGLLGLIRQRWFAGTEGTGIPQTIAVLGLPSENALRQQLLSWRVAIGKLVLTCAGLLSGA